MKRRKTVLALALGLTLALGWFLWAWQSYPNDRTVEGAYFRVVSAVNRGKPAEFFAYTETRAQHACFTIKRYREKARARVLESYPEPERSALAEKYRRVAAAPDGPDVFALYAEREHWLDRLRRDMSGIKKVEVAGERATVETVKGTRYPFRRRDNGIWGLTIFTATLVAEAERAARDYELIDQAARDYQRTGTSARIPAASASAAPASPP
ncbi:MAG TPA: hypothetical protein VI197_17895 [Polyangiaceae bacterium]